MLIRALQILTLQKTYTDTVPRVDGLMNGHLSVYSGTIVFHCEIHSYSSLHVYHQTIRHIYISTAVCMSTAKLHDIFDSLHLCRLCITIDRPR